MAHHVPLPDLIPTNCSHVCQNVTTIEALEKTRYVHSFPTSHHGRRSSDDSHNAFDIGRRGNWDQVMGSEPLKWFLPIRNSMGNGLAFPVNEDVRRILRGMMARGEGVVLENAVDDDEDGEWRREGPGGKWMRHD